MAVTVPQGVVALQDQQDSQVTKELLENLVQLVPEETRDRMEYQDPLGRREQWEVGDSLQLHHHSNLT